MESLKIPDDIDQAIKLPAKTKKKELYKLLAIKLYQNGILGIGKARELADLSLIDFMKCLDSEGVPLNYDEEEFKRDIDNIKSIE